MTTTAAPSDTAVAVRATPEERRATIIGVVLVAMALFALWAFSLNVAADLDATFKLSLPSDRFADIEWTVNTRTLGIVISVLIGVLGAIQLRRAYLQWTNIALAIGLLLFVLSFLAWAAAGQSFSLVGMLRSAVILSVPVTLGALTGLMGERVAVINIGIEGQLLTSAFVAAILGSAFNIWVGLFGAVLTGGILGAFLAVMSIRYKVDQIIAGVVINIFAAGLTAFVASRVLAQAEELNSPGRFTTHAVPWLSDIPVLGPMFFDHSMFVYGTIILVAFLHFGFFYTRWGLRARSVGEHPKAADTLGINVYRIRYQNVILGGFIAGFGGAFLTLSQLGRFDEGMTAGVGFIGLAAMIFGRWLPYGAWGAGLVFGFSRGVQQKLGILGTPIPSEFLSMAPYIATIIVVAGLVGRARPPAADGQPYVRE